MSSSSRNLFHLAHRFNNFFLNVKFYQECTPFVCDGHQVGLITPHVLEKLQKHQDLFFIGKEYITFNENRVEPSCDKRSEALAEFWDKQRAIDGFITLRGWRDEQYEIKQTFSGSTLFQMERSATPILGVRQYGVHINGYVKCADKQIRIWIQKRASNKQTYPGKLDSMVGGGLSVGNSVRGTAIKELQEEAGIVLDRLPKEGEHACLAAAGSVSFFHQSERGIHPQTEFVYDLQLPEDFIPENQDGEAESFVLVTPKELIQILLSEDYKPTSIPVALDWLGKLEND